MTHPAAEPQPAGLRRVWPGLSAGRAAALAALAAGFILYVSLYPFRLRPMPPGATALGGVLGNWAWPAGGRGDLVANLVLYAPLGLFLAAGLAGRLRAAPSRLALVTLCGALLSGVMELAQFHIAGRISSALDLALNTLGCLLGALVAPLLGGAAGSATTGLTGRIAAQPFPALLLLAWLGWRLYPYPPVLDVQKYRDSLKPLLLASSGLEPLPALRLAVLWLLAAHLIEVVAGRRGAGRLVPLALLGVAGAGISLPGRVLTPTELLGAGLALLAWAALRGPMRRGMVLLPPLLAVLLADRLAPFRFGEAGQPFGWVPFLSLLQGRWGPGLQAMLEKSFLYGGLLWLLRRQGLPLGLAAALEVGLLFATGLAQTRLPGRSAEITDAVLAVGLALVFALLGPGAGVAAGARGAAPQREETARPPAAEPRARG